MKTLILTVGLPRSGKSTWAMKTGFPVVNPDSIRLAVHGQPFIPEAEPLVWVTAKMMVRALFLAGHETVVLDATNLTEARRDEWNSSQWNTVYQVFQTPADVCIDRAIKGDRQDLLPVIDHMNFNAQFPEEW